MSSLKNKENDASMMRTPDKQAAQLDRMAKLLGK